jgi:hypothetical protein
VISFPSFSSLSSTHHFHFIIVPMSHPFNSSMQRTRPPRQVGENGMAEVEEIDNPDGHVTETDTADFVVIKR